MTGFDHRGAGPPSAAWDALVDGLPALAGPAAHDHLLVIAAHPDDETLGAGGLIATAARVGARVTVVVATDGAASHPGSSTHEPSDLARRRAGEVRSALTRLAPSATLSLLGLPDGRLGEHEHELTAAVREMEGCTLVVTTWAGDRHPDHEVCAAVGSVLARTLGVPHWQFPIWAWHWDEPAASTLAAAQPGAVQLDRAASSAKSQALACYTSQHTALSDAAGDEAVVPVSVLAAAARDREVYVASGDTPHRYFDDMYDRGPDPWDFDGKFYEHRKRSVLMSVLPRERFRRAFEPGCANGALTEQLAARCDRLLAWELDRRAAAAAADRVSADPGVEVRQGDVAIDWPTGEFDLVVISELGYYFTDLRPLATRVHACLAADGVLVACHWRHPVPEHVQAAEDVHGGLGGSLRRIVRHLEDDFLLDVWTLDGRSVASLGGLVA